MLDAQVIFNAGISLIGILMGVMLKSIYDAIKDLRNADGELRESDGDIHERINRMTDVYVRRDDFMSFARDIKDTLLRIETKLDGKADK